MVYKCPLFYMSRCIAMLEKYFKENIVKSLDDIKNLVSTKEFDKFNFHWFKSIVPEKCTQEPCVMGVDEAGRGPVLGPMVYSVFYCPTNDISILKDFGCTDSKTLTEKKREIIFDLIAKSNDKIGWAVDVISPNKISNDMQKRIRWSLNEIAQNSTIALINSILESNVNLKEIYVDTIGPPDKYQIKLSKLFPNIKVIVEKKADSLYPVVGAASICAKVIRDTVIEKWTFVEDIPPVETNVGTGYPGDPKSKKFLIDIRDDVFGFPNLVRFSWSTAGNLLESSFNIQWGNENDENNLESANLTSYFKSKREKECHKTSFTFFRERHLNNIDSF